MVVAVGAGSYFLGLFILDKYIDGRLFRCYSIISILNNLPDHLLGHKLLPAPLQPVDIGVSLLLILKLMLLLVIDMPEDGYEREVLDIESEGWLDHCLICVGEIGGLDIT